MKRRLPAIIAAAVAFAACFIGAVVTYAPWTPLSAPDSDSSVMRMSFSLPSPTPEMTPEAVLAAALNMDELRQLIETEIASSDGVWSVYVKDMAAGSEILINDAPMKAASVMKLFVMGAAFDNIQNGVFEYGDIKDDMYYMITESSNESANTILYTLGGGSYADGIAKVNEFNVKYGFNEKTVEYNGFDNPDTVVGGSFNVTSALDCGRMLDAIYNGSCVSPETSQQMLELLKEQQTDYKLVYNLPKQIVVANKSDEVENDVGIVYSPERDYIICVLSNSWSDDAEAIETIQDISQTTYEFFNPDSQEYSLVVGEPEPAEE